MSLVLQISDTHFGTEIPSVVKALHELAREQQPSLVIWSGDVTQRARRSQFTAAASFASELAKVAKHMLVVPGNHDIPLFDLYARVANPYGNYERVFGSTLEPNYESDELLVLGLNTTRWFTRKDGVVSDAQIERVASRLRAARPGQLRIVVTHQPLQAIRESDLSNLLHGYQKAARVWSQAGADIFMGGHIHLPYIRRLRDSLRAQQRETWIVQAGTATSKRIREGVPNSINLIRSLDASNWQCLVERWDYVAATGRFRQIDRHELAVSREPLTNQSRAM
jgi:predicted phosphodiesterase